MTLTAYGLQSARSEDLESPNQQITEYSSQYLFVLHAVKLGIVAV